MIWPIKNNCHFERSLFTIRDLAPLNRQISAREFKYLSQLIQFSLKLLDYEYSRVSYEFLAFLNII